MTELTVLQGVTVCSVQSCGSTTPPYGVQMGPCW